MKVTHRILIFLWLFFLEINMVFAAVDLKAKIGQMLILGIKGDSLEYLSEKALLDQRLGGIILFDYNIKNPQQLAQFTYQLQKLTKQAAIRHQNDLYPLFVSIDYEGGKVATRLNEKKGFPRTLSAAEIGQLSEKEAYAQAAQMADTLKNSGVNLNFAPVMDVNINPSNPIIAKLNRSFSSNPGQVSFYASLFSKAYQEHQILCAYKHFPGHGSSTGDTHEGFVDVTQTWKPEELTPYRQLINHPYACPMVLTAHVTHYGLDPEGYPASLSFAIATNLLRKELGFKGVIITDDMQMKAIVSRYGLNEALILAINGGADILIFSGAIEDASGPAQKLVEMIYENVKMGKIPEGRIEEAYERIMKLKLRLREKNNLGVAKVLTFAFNSLFIYPFIDFFRILLCEKNLE